MRMATVKLVGVSPYSQSAPVMAEKLDKETHKDYEARTWKERAHLDRQGKVFVPPMALKNCLSDAAKYLSIQIPGKGKATYTKHFEAGVAVVEPMALGITMDDEMGEWVFVPSDGKRGGTKRVWKRFPFFPDWSGTAIFHILDDTITEKVFENHLRQAGQFIGLGRFRPRNNGYYGRFAVEGVVWG